MQKARQRHFRTVFRTQKQRLRVKNEACAIKTQSLRVQKTNEYETVIQAFGEKAGRMPSSEL
jgi:hypothetical protein